MLCAYAHLKMKKRREISWEQYEEVIGTIRRTYHVKVTLLFSIRDEIKDGMSGTWVDL